MAPFQLLLFAWFGGCFACWLDWRLGPGSEMRALNEILNAVRDTIPGAIIVGASAYPIYAGNLYYDHDRPDGWFNAATGFGALGYGIPAAIGAALAALDTPSDPYNWRWRCSV